MIQERVHNFQYLIRTKPGAVAIETTLAAKTNIFYLGIDVAELNLTSRFKFNVAFLMSEDHPSLYI